MGWILRRPRLLISLAALLLFLAALLIHPVIYCKAYFEIAMLPAVVSYDGIMKYGDQKEVDNLLALLTNKQDDAIAHEGAHKMAYGEWSGKTYYYYYKTMGKDYALAGCTPFKLGAPLDILRRSALAPVSLTDADRFVAHFIQSAILFFDFRLADAWSELAKALSISIKDLGPPFILFGGIIACLYLLIRSFW